MFLLRGVNSKICNGFLFFGRVFTSENAKECILNKFKIFSKKLVYLNDNTFSRWRFFFCFFKNTILLHRFFLNSLIIPLLEKHQHLFLHKNLFWLLTGLWRRGLPPTSLTPHLRAQVKVKSKMWNILKVLKGWPSTR